MYQLPSSSLVDMYGVGAASAPVVEQANPAAAVRLAFDRQRLLEFSLRNHHHRRHPPPPPTVSAPTAAATTLLDPSAFCLPVVSIPDLLTAEIAVSPRDKTHGVRID